MDMVFSIQFGFSGKTDIINMTSCFLCYGKRIEGYQYPLRQSAAAVVTCKAWHN